MKKSIWKERVRKNASVKSLGPCDRAKRGVYTQEGQSIFTIKGKKKEVQVFVEDQLRKEYI